MTWVLQLLLLAALYFQQFQGSSVGKVVFPQVDESVIAARESSVGPGMTLPTSGLFTFFAVLAGLAFVAWAVYLVTLRYIPAINKTANKVVQIAAEQSVVQTARITHKKLPVRKQRLLTARIVWWLKFTISLVPLVVVMIAPASPFISKQATTFIVAVLSLWAVLCFGAQTVLAKFWRLSDVTK